MKKILGALARSVAVLALVAALAGVLLALDRYASYHSPLRSTQYHLPPRQEALQDIRLGTLRAPEPTRYELRVDMTPEEMAEFGGEIVRGKGTCLAVCHTLGGSGGRAPDLDGVGARAASRVEGMNAVEYLAQSLYAPEAYKVEGYSLVMPPANEPPINLSDDEILMVIAYLQSLGGAPSVTPQTERPFGSGS